MAQPNPRDSLAAYVRVQQATDRKVLALLLQAYRDVNRQFAGIVGVGPGATVAREQALLARAAILERTAILMRDLGELVAEERLLSAAAADREMLAYDSVLMRAVEDQARVRAYLRGEVKRSQEAVGRAEARLFGTGYIPLSQQVYRTGVVSAGIIDSAVNSALARNLTAKQFASEVAHLVDPNTPGGVSYAAMRLARTEINNAFHATAIQKARETPWTAAMKWHLSGSHPRPDECNDYADDDQFGRGAGVFPVDDVPVKPHPQCLCFVTPINLDEDEWLDSFFAGDYNAYIDSEVARRRAA